MVMPHQAANLYQANILNASVFWISAIAYFNDSILHLLGIDIFLSIFGTGSAILLSLRTYNLSLNIAFLY